MGLYDTIMVYMKCPYCEKYQHFDAQTKDLGSMMFTYYPLDKDWGSKKDFIGKKFRTKLPVFRRFPLDKTNIWKDQAELIEAQATVPEEFAQKKFVYVIADCDSDKCKYSKGNQKFFHGKIKIKNGKLIGEIYDIEKEK